MNGPYNDVESNVRYLQHWLTIFLETGDSKLISQYLSFWEKEISTILERNEFLPTMRENNNKDSINGVIGVAWYLDGFCDLKESQSWYTIDNKLLTKIEDYIKKVVLKYFNKGFPFKILDEKSNIIGFDRTFNHQLWCLSVLIRSNKLFNIGIDKYRIQQNINTLFNILHVKKNGIIYHTIKTKKHFSRTFLKRVLKNAYRNDMNIKEYGYHAFNLLGFIKLFSEEGFYFPEPIRFCNNKIVTSIINNDINNKYGSIYNPIGFELGAFLSRFCSSSDDSMVLKLINYHFQKFFESKNFCFKSKQDEICLNARFYEYTYISKHYKKILSFDGVRWYFED